MVFNPLSKMPGSKDRLSLSAVEEQAVPFLSTESIEESTSTPPIIGGSTGVRILSYCCYVLSIILFVGGLWRQPSEAQCIRKLNAWCEY